MRTTAVGILTAIGLCVGCATMENTAKTDAPGKQRTYDLTANWSSTQNPNGVWSYNHSASPITKPLTWEGNAGWGYLPHADGCVIKLNNPDPCTGGYAGYDRKSGDVVMHALSQHYEGATKFVNVTWTSPSDGSIDIQGKAWDAGVFKDRDMSWSLIVGGKTIAQKASVRGVLRKDNAAQFASNLVAKEKLTGIPVTRGTCVEFRIATSTFYGQFVGVEEQIVLTEAK